MRISLLLLSSVASWAVAAQTSRPVPAATPAPAAPPIKTRFADVRAGRYPTGTRVDFPALVVPETTIQVTSGGPPVHFALAVASDGDFFQRLSGSAEAARGRGFEIVRELEKEVEDDSRFNALLDEFWKLMEAVPKNPLPQESIAVELASFGAASKTFEWKTVINKMYGVDMAPLALPTLRLGCEPNCAMPTTIEAARASIRALASARPPKLDQRLPNLDLVKPDRASQASIDSFNGMIQEFNRELYRRRHYQVQAAGQTLTSLLAGYDRLSKTATATFSATVIARPDLAVETFTKIHKSAPAVFVRERAAADQTVAHRFFRTTNVLIGSYPTGANLSISGISVGTTPYVAFEVAAGQSLNINVAMPGYRPKQVLEKISASPVGLRQLDYVLEPDATAGAAPPALTATAPPAKPAAPAAESGSLAFTVIDNCWDGQGVIVKFFDKANNQVWPAPPGTYQSNLRGNLTATLSCRAGARICYGATTDPQTKLSWGVGLDGTAACEDCCASCGGPAVTKTLSCN